MCGNDIVFVGFFKGVYLVFYVGFCIIWLSSLVVNDRLNVGLSWSI